MTQNIATIRTQIGYCLLYLGICLIIQAGTPPASVQAQANDIRDCPMITGTAPRSNPNLWCYDVVLENDDAGVLGYTALAWWQDRLVATRPLRGELIAIEDIDGDGKLDAERIIAEGMVQPNALAVNGEDLYIAGGQFIYRIDADEHLQVLTDDLPAGGGMWTGGIAIVEGMIYVGTGASCARCTSEADIGNGRGAIWQYRIADDGTAQDGRIIAEGLRYPAGLWVQDGILWVTDTARWDIDETYLDELNQIDLAQVVTEDVPYHFGYPYCVGADNHADATFNPDGAVFDCTTTQLPTYVLETQSHPQALAYYPFETEAQIDGHMIVVLRGSPYTGYPQGYSLIALRRIGDDTLASTIIPTASTLRTDDTRVVPMLNDGRKRAPSIVSLASNYVNSIYAGLFPRHPYGVAVDDNGRIYYSWGETTIISMTPR